MNKELTLALISVMDASHHLRAAHAVCKNEFAEIVLRDLLEEFIKLHRKTAQVCAASKI